MGGACVKHGGDANLGLGEGGIQKNVIKLTNEIHGVIESERHETKNIEFVAS